MVKVASGRKDLNAAVLPKPLLALMTKKSLMPSSHHSPAAVKKPFLLTSQFTEHTDASFEECSGRMFAVTTLLPNFALACCLSC